MINVLTALFFIFFIQGNSSLGSLESGEATNFKLGRPRSMLLEGSHLYVALQDLDQVLMLDKSSGVIQQSIITGIMPTDLIAVPAQSPSEIWVVCRGESSIYRYAVNTLALIGQLALPNPASKLTAAGNEVFVLGSNTLFTYDISSLPNPIAGQDRGGQQGPSPAAARARARASTFPLQETVLPAKPLDIIVDSTNNQIFVGLMNQNIAVIDLGTLQIVQQIPVGLLPGGFTLTDDTDNSLIVCHLGLNGNIADDQIWNTISKINRSTLTITKSGLIDCATPIASAFDAANRTYWVAFYGADKVIQFGINGVQIQKISVGPNPRDVLIDPNTRKLFVLNELGDSIQVISNGAVRNSFALNPTLYPGLAALEGERQFNFAYYDPSNPQGSRGLGPRTCFSCHPDGSTDGGVNFLAGPGYFDNGSGVINTPALHMIHWTPPFRRDGSALNLEAQITNAFTLTRGVIPTSAELQAIKDYLKTVTLPPNPFPNDAGSIEFLRGQRFFETSNCVACHSGAMFTDGKIHDVGTTIAGGSPETPTLLGLAESAPYLNDGRALALEDVFAPISGRHEPWITGTQVRKDLAIYLRSLVAPNLVWSVPQTVIAADGVQTVQIHAQVFNMYGRTVEGVDMFLAQTAGPNDIQVLQPFVPTNSIGESTAILKVGTQAGIASFQIYYYHAQYTSEEKSIELVAGGTSFIDVAGQAGLDFQVPQYAYPRATAFGDYDGDGNTDIFVAVSGKDQFVGAHFGVPNYLFRNRGDGTFEDVSNTSGIRSNPPRSSSGATWVDLDQDGDLDLYVGNRGAAAIAADELYWNNGNGTFTEGAQAAGLDNDGFSYSILISDYDQDSDLDVYVQNLTICCNEGNIRSSGLYRNNGDKTFTNVTAQAGMTTWATLGGDGGAVFDYNNDGFQDMIETTAQTIIQSYHLAKNQGDGTFTNEWINSNLGFGVASVGVIPADFDNDGFLDVFANGTGFYRNNNADGTFTNVTPQIGFDYTQYSGHFFGCEAGDFNNDGKIDIAATNGFAHPLAIFLNQTVPGSGIFSFQELKSFPPLVEDLSGRTGLAVLDYNNDGWLDIFWCREGDTSDGFGQTQVLFKNQLNNGNNFLFVTLESTAANAPNTANGGRIYLYDSAGVQMREIATGRGSSASADYKQHFGVGADRTVNITVYWPISKTQQKFFFVPVNQQIRLFEGNPNVLTERSYFDVDVSASTVSDTATALTVQFSTFVHHAVGAVTYVWDFGDGQIGVGPAPVHVFDKTINPNLTPYNVTCTVLDNGSNESATTQVVVQ